jgi:hypothetical protein
MHKTLRDIALAAYTENPPGFNSTKQPLGLRWKAFDVSGRH